MSTPQTFNTAFPFDIKIQNLYQGENLSVLYILDKNKTQSDMTNLLVRLIPNNNAQFQLSGFSFSDFQGDSSPVSSIPALSPSNANFSPSSLSHNISIAFRPGVLSETVVPNFSAIFQKAIALAVPNNICCVNGPLVRPTDGAFVWYCAFQKILDIPNGLIFTLPGVSASAGVGSRSTQIEIGLNELMVNGSTSKLKFKRHAHVDIINHQGNTFAPLYFGVLGENTLKNNSANSLQLYFETVGRVPIEFGPNTTFSFSFPYDSPASNLLHFGDENHVKGITWGDIEGKNEVVPYNNTNQFNGASNVNFNGQYSLNTTPATDDNGGNIVLTQTFKHEKQIANPQYTSLENQITALQNDIKSSTNFYQGTNGPLPILQNYLNTYIQNLDWKKENVDANFLSQLNGLNQAYQAVLQSTQSLIASVLSGAQDKDGNPLANVRTVVLGYVVDCSKPFSTTAFDSKFNLMFYSVMGSGGVPCIDNTNVYWFPNNLNYQVMMNPGPNHSNATMVFGSSDNITNSPLRWADQNFVQFLDNNFNAVIQNLAISYKSSWDFFFGITNGVVCSRYLYDYLKDVYNLYKQYKQNLLIAGSLVSTNGGFTKTQWISASVNSKSFFASKNLNASLLTTDKSTVLTQFSAANPWLDDEFFNYVQENLKSLISGFCINGNYLIPCASLYDYFYFNYQLNLYSSLLANVPQNLNFYINPVNCIFNFNTLNVSGRDGQAVVRVKVENLPGYWDTEFQIPLLKKSDFGVPSGSVLVYKGSKAPQGWTICDGQNNTPNLASQTAGTIWIIKN